MVSCQNLNSGIRVRSLANCDAYTRSRCFTIVFLSIYQNGNYSRARKTKVAIYIHTGGGEVGKLAQEKLVAGCPSVNQFTAGSQYDLSEFK
ncbi:hypothetical protein M758_2G088600 [Ceratodon purpureus]|nr:hypothetical protein M758_2G088600 [Ceratodon purpureus]